MKIFINLFPKVKMMHCPQCIEMNEQLKKACKSKRVQLGMNVPDKFSEILILALNVNEKSEFQQL